MWSGHVYDLQSVSGLKVVNGIVCSNCRGYDEFVVDFKALDELDAERLSSADDVVDDLDPSAVTGGGGRGVGDRGGGGDDRDDDDGGNVTPPGYLDFEESREAQAFDRSINGPRRLGGENSPAAQRLLREISAAYYDDLYDDPDLQRRGRELVAGWSEDRQENPYRAAVVEAWARLFRGEAPTTGVERTVKELYGTRRERWERLANLMGTDASEGFRVFRGVRGDVFVGDVVEAWRDPVGAYMPARQVEAASWSLRRETAERFATVEGRYGDSGVLFDADVAFARTLADKLVDDGRFVVPYRSQWEIIVGSPEPNGVMVPVSRAIVTYRGRTYGFADRLDLIAAWDARGD